MATLLSPGVEVTVVDESQYGSPGTGTVPFIVLATRENKTDPSGTFVDGIAPYTKKENANKLFRASSQRELTQFLGDAIFEKNNNAVVQGSETSEYGLLAAYSFLGQGSSVFAIRADVDLGSLEAQDTPPTGPLEPETHWLDTDGSVWGIHVYDDSIARWRYVEPLTVVIGDGTSLTTPVIDGEFIVTINPSASGVFVRYFVGNGTLDTWEVLTFDNSSWQPHYSVPTSPSDGDIWIKTTSLGNGVDLRILQSDFNGDFVAADGGFNIVTVEGVTNPNDPVTYIPQNGTGNTAIELTPGFIELTITAAGDAGSLTDQTMEISVAVTNLSVGSIQEDFVAQDNEPTGNPEDGKLWYDSTITNSLDLFINTSTGWDHVEEDLSNTVYYSTTAPTGASEDDIWVDTNAETFPTIYRYVNNSWRLHDNTDQSTTFGVIFGDIRRPNADLSETNLSGFGPEPALYPEGMILVNMPNSSNTVREYNASDDSWANAAPNNVDGSGNFGRFAQRKVIATKMQAALASNEEIREENKNFTVLCAPNYPELTDELIQLNSDRGETGFIVIDAPMRKRPSEMEAWIDGRNAVENGEDGLITKNTYSAVYYPSLRTTTTFGDTVTVPASHGILYQYAYNDNIAYPWFSPAGLTRGVVQNATGVGYIDSQENEFRPLSLSNSQRDTLYVNKINPIANFPSDGIVVFGDKSLHQEDSALDRVNVARLVAYLRERFDDIGRPFLFEQNTQAVRDRVKSVYENFLFDIVSKRGITDFSVLCDSSNNTPERIDRNELWVDIAIIPTKSINYIYIPIRLRNTGDL